MDTSEKNPFDSSDDEEKLQPKEIERDVSYSPVYQPECESEELEVKPFCECDSCNHFTKSADWCTASHLKFEADNTKKTYKERKLLPLFRSAKHPGKTPKIITFNPDNLTKLERKTLFRTLVHGEAIPQPITLLSDTYFSKDMQSSLQTLNYKYSLPIQSFAWPAIFRQMNVFMIGGHKSGKTMSYLPAVCTFSTQPCCKYDLLEKYKGPLVIIICRNSKQCEEIFDLIKKLYSSIQFKPRIFIMTYPITNIHNTDILITIPESLMHCLKSRIINFKRLCHLVLEDASSLLNQEGETVSNILTVVDQMLQNRVQNIGVQLIVSSEKWTKDLKELFKSIYVTPLVCIGNYLEAALYGNTQFEIKFLMSDQKKAYLEGIVKNKSDVYKTLIICNNSEIADVEEWLLQKGINSIALTDSSNKEEIEACETEWASTRGGQYKVLLCTDFVFDSLLWVSDAMWLIHYSFASTWTRFTKRFSALSSHYKSPWESSGEKLECKTFVMIDETCEAQMPKILNLLNRLSKDLPRSYQKYADGFRTKAEQEKINNNVDLCDNLKLLGKCQNPLCKNRHLVSNEVDVREDLPKNGKIVFKILTVKDVTHYAVQLIEHVDLSGCVRQINNDDLKKPLVFDVGVEKKRARDIKIGKFYAHCEHTTSGQEFMLCHVLTIPDDTFVEVKLTTGITLQTLQKNLYEAPPNLQIVDVHMSNLVPPFKDEYFSGRSYRVTRTSLESVDYKNMILTADVHLQLDNTLWVDNVVETLKVKDCDLVKFNLTKHLLTSIEVVEVSKMKIASLHKLCMRCDITLPRYVKQTVKKPVRMREMEPQWSFLGDGVNQVILSAAVSPEEFYVRLQKFQCLLENLEKDIQKAVKTELLDKNLNIVVGRYYLAPDPKDEMYSRVSLVNVEDDKALCFYVDYGDEAVVDVAKLKTLPSKLVTKLPFQAIQCRLHGITPSFQEWSNEATDVLYKYMFEPNSDFFRSFYIQVCDKEKSDPTRTKIKYSVLLKDGYGDKNVLINQLLLDCGFAKSIFGRIDDFELSEVEVGQDSDETDSEKVSNENLEEFGSEFDVEIFDADAFMEMLGVSRLKISENPQKTQEGVVKTSEEKSTVRSESTPVETVPDGEPKYLTPEVFWSQSEKTVKIKVNLIGVEVYKVSVIKKRIFTFCTTLEGKTYNLKFTLHKPAELGRHRALGQEVQVILNKSEALEWSQLTGTTKRMRNIHYEIPNTEKKEPKRKFLQLDITDDESDDPNDGMMYHQESDLDSEYDQEALSSSD